MGFSCLLYICSMSKKGIMYVFIANRCKHMFHLYKYLQSYGYENPNLLTVWGETMGIKKGNDPVSPVAVARLLELWYIPCSTRPFALITLISRKHPSGMETPDNRDILNSALLY